MNRRPLRHRLSLAIVSVLWGCQSPNVDLAEARYLYEHADYFQAYQAIVRARAITKDDPEIEADFWRIRHAYLLHEAQRLVFASHEVEALESLEMVLALDPENAIALRWKNKALQQLSEEAVAEGDRLVAAGELRPAQQEFSKALGFMPGNPNALEGLARLGETWEQQQSTAKRHFRDGLRALGDYEYVRTAYHLGIAIKKDPTLNEAVDPAQLAERQIAEERYAKACALEAAGYFIPALLEFHAIEKTHPELDGLAEHIAAATIERDVTVLADDGELAAFRGDFTKARALLDEALAKTTRQQDMIAERILLTSERSIEQRLLAARDLELQHRLEDALAGYVAVDESMAGFRDVRARITDLRLRIEEAKSAYAEAQQAESAGDLDAAIEHYRDVQLYWSGYLDSRARLDTLRQKRDAARSGG